MEKMSTSWSWEATEKFRCDVSKDAIFSLSTKIGYNRLLLAFLRDQRGVKEEAISSSGPLIGGISYSISIKVGLQNKRLNRKVHNVEKGALKISKNKTVS